jgi:hypothetical protein
MLLAILPDQGLFLELPELQVQHHLNTEKQPQEKSRLFYDEKENLREVAYTKIIS